MNEFAEHYGYYPYLEFVRNDKVYIENPRITKAANFKVLLDYLGYNLQNKRVLELGPGWAAFLNLAREEGASVVRYVDYSPIVVGHCTLNGFSGYVDDFYSWNVFSELLRKGEKFDFIISRGSINADRFNRLNKKWKHFIKRLDSLLVDGGIAVISPTYDSGSDMEYRVSDINFLKSTFATTLYQKGFANLVYVEGFTSEFFPYNFIKVK